MYRMQQVRPERDQHRCPRRTYPEIAELCRYFLLLPQRAVLETTVKDPIRVLERGLGRHGLRRSKRQMGAQITASPASKTLGAADKFTLRFAGRASLGDLLISSTYPRFSSRDRPHQQRLHPHGDQSRLRKAWPPRQD